LSAIKWPAISLPHRMENMTREIEQKHITVSGVPSTARIVKAALIAVAVAAAILLTTVLPAEYGIDPLGTGTAIGLMDLSKAEAAPDVNSVGRASVAPVQAGTYTGQPKIYKVDSQELFLRPGEGVEIKYHMEKGAVMVYSWQAGGKLQYEFHGEPDQKPNKDYYDSYELDNTVGIEQSHGSFTAPSTGIHGWFWENKGDKEVELHLRTAGFFDSAKMFAGGDPEDLPVQDAK
jgi:hypothetical protein